MAEFLGAVATSPAPPIFLEPEHWTEHSDLTDRNNPELVSPRTGRVTAYPDLVAEVAADDPELLGRLSDEVFRDNFDRMAAATGRLRAAIGELAPDVVLVISDDQEEIFFDDNMPMFSVYWGKSWTLLPWRSHRTGANPLYEAFKKGWGDRELEVPVDAEAGEHVIATLAGHDFGIALRRAVETMPGGKRVLLIASGGLSHFVLDEELDRLLITGLRRDDRAVLENLPRLDSPTGEIRNWIAAAGACSGMRFELFDYVPTPRSAAGTGGGWCFARWTPAR